MDAPAHTSRPTDEIIGQVVGPYRVESELGRGGMGTVYLARATTGARVAVKVLHRHLGYDRTNVKRFFREAEAGARLHHPAILRTLGAGEMANGYYYFAMEYFRGRTLEDLLATRGPLSERQALAIGYRIAGGLAYAHRKGVLHRDIKPANIMLNRQGAVRIADFGIAKALWDRRLTQTGTILGTPAYCPPEQLNGRDIDGRADLYALGVTLYELVTGALPYPGATAFEVMQQVLVGDATPLCAHGREVTDETVALVERLMAHDRDARLRRATRALDAIEDRLHHFLAASRTASGFEEALKAEAQAVFLGAADDSTKDPTTSGAAPATPVSAPAPAPREEVATQAMMPPPKAPPPAPAAAVAASTKVSAPLTPPRARPARPRVSLRNRLARNRRAVGLGALAAATAIVWSTGLHARVAAPVVLRLMGQDARAPRVAAVYLTRSLGDSVVPHLLAALPTATKRQRQTIYASLGTIDSPAATRALRGGLGDDYPKARAAALAALGERDVPDLADVCLTALADENPDVRAVAVGLLERHPDPAYLPRLVRAYDGADGDLRHDLNRALGAYGDAAFPYMAAAWPELGQNGKRALVEAAGRVGGPEATRFLVGALDEPEYAVRFFVVEALEHLTGAAFGDDPAAWRAWAADHLPAA